MTEIIIASVAVLIGISAFVYSRFSMKKSHDQRGLLEFLGKRMEDLEETVTNYKEINETDVHRISEQSRRIAWLESRVRNPKASEEDVLLEDHLEDNSKSIITERRHRVLKLAARGQSIDEIASTLGMMQGEVQLIINLSRITA